MPGKTPYEAYKAFVTPLARALACVAAAKIQPSAGGMSIMHQDHHLFMTRQGDDDYHWHPIGDSHAQLPHLHVGSAQLRKDGVIGRKHHLPTGRVTFESVVRTAIEFGARPLRRDWAEVLQATENTHVRHRTWSADPGREILR